MLTILLTLLGFGLGALPFSVWVGQLGLKQDIRKVGDRNPGATNVLRSGGVLWFGLALALDISKGALPAGLATYIFQLPDWSLVPIALAPSLGHAFSPLLNFRGGKAIAATFGVWIGLTLWRMPLVSLALLVFWFLVQDNSGWAVLLTMAGMLLAILWWQLPAPYLAIWLGQLLLLTWTHRQDLRQRPRRRQLSWLSRS
ncbi:MAG: glycerol-3-phosphate acyltransferase [Anaerolineales bacterium]|nr:glycerol-3-phosphate acyltransferase [Anaerolineales bacterium]MCB0011420.1 glycerol-3-phosphate acyltransferase [Anaerolineales bacterium]